MRSRPTSSGSLAKQCGRMAEAYDRDKETRNWNGPDIVFGLAYEFIKANETLLDIGIGTGLSALPFYKAGLKIYGMDLSPAMLTVCRKKGFADKLKVHDLTIQPYPYSDASMNHAICVGVLNHFKDLRVVFDEASRILKDNGVFGFVVADRKKGEGAQYDVRHAGSCHRMFRHSREDVRALLNNSNFSLLKGLTFSMPGHGHGGFHQLTAYITRKNGGIAA